MALIDKDAIAEHLFLSEEYQYGGDGYQDGIKDAIKAINHFPEVDAKPVVHGEWKDTECGTMCSHCHRVFDSVFEIKHYVCIRLAHCPDCGADMRGDSNAEND